VFDESVRRSVDEVIDWMGYNEFVGFIYPGVFYTSRMWEKGASWMDGEEGGRCGIRLRMTWVDRGIAVVSATISPAL
jgi:hypothetical protein